MATTRVTSIFRPKLFAGKSAIVTGGGTGIGKAITQELLHLGCRVMIASRKEDVLRKAAEEMNAALPMSGPAKLEWMTCNIRKEDQISELVRNTIDKFGGIDFLVNNGGGQFPSPADNISLKGWNAVVETNLTGTFLCSREVYNRWMKDHGGSIVSIIADMWKGFPGMSHTGAARSAVDNLTKSLSVEWAPSGVRVNSVAPGVIYSETAAANYKDIHENIFEGQAAGIPAKRLGTPEEVAAAVCFLLSPAAAFISGISMRVDGGKSLYALFNWEIQDHNKNKAWSWTKDKGENNKDPSSTTSKL